MPFEYRNHWTTPSLSRPQEMHMFVRSPSFCASGRFSVACASYAEWRANFPDANPDDVQCVYQLFLTTRGTVIVHSYPAR